MDRNTFEWRAIESGWSRFTKEHPWAEPRLAAEAITEETFGGWRTESRIENRHAVVWVWHKDRLAEEDALVFVHDVHLGDALFTSAERRRQHQEMRDRLRLSAIETYGLGRYFG